MYKYTVFRQQTKIKSACFTLREICDEIEIARLIKTPTNGIPCFKPENRFLSFSLSA